jgi:hypothetical protein
MTRRVCIFSAVLFLAPFAVASDGDVASDVDGVLQKENKAAGVELKPTPLVNDLAFLRRISIDLNGRIPTGGEIREYMKWPADQRRSKLVDKLLANERFADRWTAFMGDMLRLRSNATGGAALTAYVHQALKNNMPYDELCRRLISANGKANTIPEVGFILGDNANPTELAAVTAQVFMGVRISCAECHDHPFDVWTRKDFYGLAAYFGKTRRIESRITRAVYTTEATQTSVYWPPEDDTSAEKRGPMRPRFPFEAANEVESLEFIKRLVDLRTQQALARKAAAKNTNDLVIDDLLSSTADKAARRTDGRTDALGVASEAKSTIRKIDIQGSLYRRSELRSQLADLITSPRNRLFARSIVNRVWKELIGRGFVEPVDDFRANNPPSHPKTMDFLAEEFVATGYDFRNLVRMIVISDTYARSHVPTEADEPTRIALESKFLATPMRRMLGEALYDSIVSAGHLFEVKHPAGANKKVIKQTVRVRVAEEGESPETPKIGSSLLAKTTGAAMTPAMMAARNAQGGGYALEDAIELDFASLLKKASGGVELDRMRIMTAEELEAQRMQMMKNVPGGSNAKYVTKIIERVYDDNPKFNSTFRMASPAPTGHFVRVFGQTSRAELGQIRSDAPSMRQALMMLNGRLTNEASRVGPLEPMHALLKGPKLNIEKAIEIAYHEILTRPPTADELADGSEIISAAASPLDGMADLRWIMLNCNEFRFLP